MIHDCTIVTVVLNEICQIKICQPRELIGTTFEVGEVPVVIEELSPACCFHRIDRLHLLRNHIWATVLEKGGNDIKGCVECDVLITSGAEIRIHFNDVNSCQFIYRLRNEMEVLATKLFIQFTSHIIKLLISLSYSFRCENQHSQIPVLRYCNQRT